MATKSPHHLLIALGIPSHEPKSSLPPSSRGMLGGGSSQDSGAAPAPASTSTPPAAGGKVSKDEAQCFTHDIRCSACENYIPEGHQCQRVDGNDFGTTTIGCIKYFTPEQAGAEMGGSEPMGDTDQLGQV